MTTNTKEFLSRFLSNEVELSDLEKWIYEDKELETSQPTLYQDLILFDFGDRDARRQIIDKLRPYIDQKEFNVWRTKRLLNKIIADQIDIVVGIRQLRELYFDTGKDFI